MSKSLKELESELEGIGRMEVVMHENSESIVSCEWTYIANWRKQVEEQIAKAKQSDLCHPTSKSEIKP
jgi:hypothetical protein